MATIATHGKDGTVDVGGAVVEVEDFNFDEELEATEATSKDSSGAREYIEGLTGTSGTFTTLTFLGKIGKQAVATFKTGTVVSAATPSYSGAILISKQGVTVPIADKVGWSYDFVFNGAVTKAVA